MSDADCGAGADGIVADGGTDGIETDEWDAVFWDIGGVILDIASVRRAHRLFLERLVDEYDLECDVEEATDVWREVVGEHFREREGTEFRSARAGYGKAIAELVGEEVPESEWLSLFREATDETLETNPGARETIATLAETDLHLGVISDADRGEALAILETFDVRRHFDSFTISEDVGRTKPDPAMFEAAVETAGVDPERSVMIGDRYRHDMAGAKRHGMTTVSHGAEDGEAVDHLIRTDDGEDLTVVLDVIRGDRESDG